MEWKLKLKICYCPSSIFIHLCPLYLYSSITYHKICPFHSIYCSLLSFCFYICDNLVILYFSVYFSLYFSSYNCLMISIFIVFTGHLFVAFHVPSIQAPEDLQLILEEDAKEKTIPTIPKI
ncbi:hypothetical protein GIB67_040690 [Kingdonia uniflora]|uniref:Uncharacterized protein n=1 Tax=Kingdonia uniflora TaxID=39325 RepID=A0A7J7KU95_9MAGN|nr:hypothetical protein GIB67_040690 [Kingdonia uniflora]